MAYTPLNRILLGAVAPIAIYYVGRKFDMALVGAVAASLWGLGVLGWFWVKTGEADGFSGIGAAYALSELAGVLVMRDPDWYLMSPIVSDWVLGGVFLASMGARKPLIQILAEQMAGIDAFPEEIRTSKYYRSLWLRLSFFWGGAYVLKGVVAWGIMNSMSVEIYLAARLVLGWPVVAGLIALSYWYPRRYWQRVM
ncbi:hypothetical protein SYK_16700 [Pseudodesulfovibrio nedwellii]|uniref:Intracellular septation protein A n=1 Tax=Pseudodesulfovibrio nedwellii TaxID=2973072 RepID=A0ABM8B167_9BACT|nr:VC0807 family protein [Pseudodesulfovibrio nedwellii]BDQ37310.1 hypothetical protein SYK_16700 [Pseudodesulfovibrio nedwellii]